MGRCIGWGLPCVGGIAPPALTTLQVSADFGKWILQIPRKIRTGVTMLLHDGADLAETASQGRTALHDAADSADAGITGLQPR